MSSMHVPAESEDLELRYYLGVLWRRKTSLVFTIVLVVAAVLLYAQRQTPIYRSTAEVLLQGRLSEDIFAPDSDTDRGQAASRTRLDTEIAVMRSQSVRGAVEEELGRPVDVSILPQGETDVVTITATSTDPQEAARIAQAYAETYISIRREQLVTDLLGAIETVQAEINALDGQIAQLDQPVRDLDGRILATTDPVQRSQLQAERDQLIQQREGPLTRRSTFQEELDQLRLAANLTKTGGAQIISNAFVPVEPYAPQTGRYVSMALAVGVILGLVAAFVREQLDQKVKTKQELERAVGAVPVLGVIPGVRRMRRGKEPLLVARTAPESPAAEAYRRLRTSLQFIRVSQQVQVVQVTSPTPEDGRTTTVANLGLSLVRAGRRVVLLDCNFRRPSLHSFFGLDNTVGLTSVLLNEAALTTALAAVASEPGLLVLPSGPPPLNPSELLSTSDVRQLVSSVSAEADFVIVDGPPLLPITDAIVLAGLVDAVVAVVHAKRTTRSDLARSLEVLEQVKAPLAGMVLNAANARRDRSFTYRHGPYLRRPRRRPGQVFFPQSRRRDKTDEPSAELGTAVGNE